MAKEAFKRDLANYFCMHTTCPKIEKVSKGDWQITGLQNYGSFTGSGENTENMKFYKNHPYLNGKGSTYFHFISPCFPLWHFFIQTASELFLYVFLIFSSVKILFTWPESMTETLIKVT